MSELFVRLGHEGQLVTWLVASFLLYTLASQLAWQSHWVVLGGFFSGSDRYDGRDDGSSDLVERLRHHPLVPWVEETIRLIYYLGIPFIAAVSGWLGADLMGISGASWVDGQSIQGFLWEDWARGIGLATAAVLAMAGVWFAGRLLARRAGLMPVSQGLPGPLWQRLLDVFYFQIHWAFYRSGPILWLDDPYWGIFAGLALVLLEAGLNPALWWALRSPETAGPPLIRLGMAWISALVFLATRNLWLTTAAHLVLVGLIGGRRTDSYSYVDGATS